MRLRSSGRTTYWPTPPLSLLAIGAIGVVWGSTQPSTSLRWTLIAAGASLLLTSRRLTSYAGRLTLVVDDAYIEIRHRRFAERITREDFGFLCYEWLANGRLSLVTQLWVFGRDGTIAIVDKPSALSYIRTDSIRRALRRRGYAHAEIIAQLSGSPIGRSWSMPEWATTALWNAKILYEAPSPVRRPSRRRLTRRTG